MSSATPRGPDLECLDDPARAEALLHPLRLRIVSLLAEPASASEVARRLRLPRQRVNYHVRRLFERGLLRRAGRRARRNMVEQRYVASARGFLFVPELLGGLSADWRAIGDASSAAYLLGLTAQMQSDLARASRAGREEGSRLSTLSLKAQFRFESPAQRAEFARALREAVVQTIARFTAVDDREESAGEGAYRLVVGCYPYAKERPGGRPERVTS